MTWGNIKPLEKESNSFPTFLALLFFSHFLPFPPSFSLTHSLISINLFPTFSDFLPSVPPFSLTLFSFLSTLSFPLPFVPSSFFFSISLVNFLPSFPPYLPSFTLSHLFSLSFSLTSFLALLLDFLLPLFIPSLSILTLFPSWFIWFQVFLSNTNNFQIDLFDS